MTPGLQKLTEILEVAQREGADAVQLEPNRGELEVMYTVGSSGIGYTIRDRRIQDEIMSFIFEKANLNKRVRGTISQCRSVALM